MAEDLRQLLHALGNPAATVIEVLAGQAVFATKKCSPHAAANAVVPGGVVKADEGGARLCHVGDPCRARRMRAMDEA